MSTSYRSSLESGQYSSTRDRHQGEAWRHYNQREYSLGSTCPTSICHGLVMLASESMAESKHAYLFSLLFLLSITRNLIPGRIGSFPSHSIKIHHQVSTDPRRIPDRIRGPDMQPSPCIQETQGRLISSLHSTICHEQAPPVRVLL
jgi:hypothetical protein